LSETRRAGPVMTVDGRLDVPRLALDVGTGRTRLASLGEPMLVEIPSTVGSGMETRGSLAVARSIQQPVEHGVIVDVDAAARMLAPQIRAGRGESPWKPRVLVCHPSDASSEERERLVAAVLMAGAAAVRLAPEPVAALLGSADVEPDKTRPRLIIDLGEGVTDIAVVQDGRVLVSAAVRLGLGEIRSEVRQEALKRHGVLLHSAEIASLLVAGVDFDGWVPVTRAPRRRMRTHPEGRRVLSHLVYVNGAVVAEVLHAALDTIAGRALGLLHALDAGEARAVATDGVLVAGGGALVPELCRGLGKRLGLGVKVAIEPLHAVIRGARRLLQDGGDDGWVSDAAFLGLAACPGARH
jgi:rod shape-determining protein MreB